MFTLIYPFINLATGSLAGISRFMLTWPQADENPLSLLWRSTLENQACFVTEYSEAVLETLAQTRRAMYGYCETIHCRSEHVATQLAHSTVRALAIATQARQEKQDRRVFPLPRLHERRTDYAQDRRLSLPLSTHRAPL